MSIVDSILLWLTGSGTAWLLDLIIMQFNLQPDGWRDVKWYEKAFWLVVLWPVALYCYLHYLYRLWRP